MPGDNGVHTNAYGRNFFGEFRIPEKPHASNVEQRKCYCGASGFPASLKAHSDAVPTLLNQRNWYQFARTRFASPGYDV